jgi:hypothetical protein
MELEGSLPRSQQPATGPNPEPQNPAHSFPHYFPSIHSHKLLVLPTNFTIILRGNCKNQIPVDVRCEALTVSCPLHPGAAGLNPVRGMAIASVPKGEQVTKRLSHSIRGPAPSCGALLDQTRDGRRALISDKPFWVSFRFFHSQGQFN